MPVAAVTDDGSPRGAMTFALWEPSTEGGTPPLGDDGGGRDPRPARPRRRAGRRVRPEPGRRRGPGHERPAAGRARRPRSGGGSRGVPRRLPAAGPARCSSAGCATARCVASPRPTPSSSASTSAGSTPSSWPAGRVAGPASGSRPGVPGARARSRSPCSSPPTTRSTRTSCATPRRSSARRSRPPSWTRTTPTCSPRTSRPPRPSCRWARADLPMFGPDARRLLDALVDERHPAAPAVRVVLGPGGPARPSTSRCAGRATSSRWSRPAPGACWAPSTRRRRTPRCTPVPCTCTRATPGSSPSSTSRPGPRTSCAATPGGRRTPSR